MTTWIGIDPGQKGGIGCILGDDEDQLGFAMKMPLTPAKEIDVVALWDMIKKCGGKPLKVAVEEVHSMPAQGVRSVFTFGRGYGKILGMMEALGISHILVPPTRWKRDMGVTANKGDSIDTCVRLFPSVRDTIGKHDGMAEGLLLAEWLRRQG